MIREANLAALRHNMVSAATLVSVLATLSAPVYAADCTDWGVCNSEPGAYKVNVKEVSLCSDRSCSEKFILGQASQEFDIVSGSGSFGAGEFTATSGTFTHFHLRLSALIGTKGRVQIHAGGIDTKDCITDSAADRSVFGFKLGQVVNRGDEEPELAYEDIRGPDSAEDIAADMGGGMSVAFVGEDVALTVPMSTPISIDTSRGMPAMSVLFYVDDRFTSQIVPRALDGSFNSADANTWACEIGSRPPKFTIRVGDQTLRHAHK